jgi:hypothetical protein
MTDNDDLDALLLALTPAKIRPDEPDTAKRKAVQEQLRRQGPEFEWTTISHLAMMSVFQCSRCGDEVVAFSHYMLRQTHRTSRITRFVAATPVILAETLPGALGKPDEVGFQIKTVPHCTKCLQVDFSGIDYLRSLVVRIG